MTAKEILGNSPKTYADQNFTNDGYESNENLSKVMTLIFLITLVILTLFGNLLLCLSILTRRYLRTIPNMMILTLSATDFLVGAVVIPDAISNILLDGNSHQDEPLKCKILGFINMFLLVMSVMNLANISFNRYNAICKPLTYRTNYTFTTCWIMIALAVFVSVILALPPFFGWSEYEYIDEQQICFARWRKSQSFTIFMISVCFGFPLCTMTYCYVQIIRAVRRSLKGISPKTLSEGTTTTIDSENVETSQPKKKTFSNADSRTKHNVPNLNTPSSSSIHTIYRSDSTQNRSNMQELPETSTFNDRISQSSVIIRVKKVRAAKQRREIQLSLTLFIVIVVFVLCWLPYCIVMIIDAFSNMPVPNVVNTLVTCAGLTNSCCNPITYGLFNREIRKAYKKFLMRLFKLLRIV